MPGGDNEPLTGRASNTCLSFGVDVNTSGDFFTFKSVSPTRSQKPEVFEKYNHEIISEPEIFWISASLHATGFSHTNVHFPGQQKLSGGADVSQS